MKETTPAPDLLEQALVIYDTQPPTYLVPTDIQDSNATEWMEVDRGAGEAAYCALEAAGRPITIKSVSILRSALEYKLAKRVNSVDPKV